MQLNRTILVTVIFFFKMTPNYLNNVCLMYFKVPAFDFSVPGVSSISADTHKYGYAPKGI